MQSEKQVLDTAARFLKAIEVPLPPVAPRVESIPINSFLVHWDNWDLLVSKRFDDPPRVYSARRAPRHLSVTTPTQPSPTQQKERAARLARALALPQNCQLTVCTAQELTWERPTLGNYPLYNGQRLHLKLSFSPSDGQPLAVQRYLDLLDGCALPPLKVDATSAQATAQALIAFAKRPAETPKEPPILAWTPFQGELTPDDAEAFLNRPKGRGLPARGPLRLAWLVHFSWCHVGVNPTTGKASYFNTVLPQFGSRRT